MDKSFADKVEERLQLLSMAIAEKYGPVLDVHTHEEARMMDERIALLMLHAYHMGQEDTARKIEQILGGNK